MYPIDDLEEAPKYRFRVLEFEIKDLFVLHESEDRYFASSPGTKAGLLRGVIRVRAKNDPGYGPFYMDSINAEKLQILIDEVRKEAGETTASL
jgi:hypothetical protein